MFDVLKQAVPFRQTIAVEGFLETVPYPQVRVPRRRAFLSVRTDLSRPHRWFSAKLNQSSNYFTSQFLASRDDPLMLQFYRKLDV